MNNERVIGDICFRKEDGVWLAVGDSKKTISITERDLGLKSYVVRITGMRPLVFVGENEAFNCVEHFIKMVMEK